MKVIYGIGRLKLTKASCVTVGVFDGLHLGHQAIIKKVVSVARENNILSVVLTFFPHPDSIIKSKKISPLLISLKHRLALIASYGVDVCVVVKFDSAFKKITAENFISGILIKRCLIKYLIINRNFIFGKNREGNADLMKKISRKFNFEVSFQRDVRSDSHIVSSTLIRSLIRQGYLKAASKLLGRRVEVIGTVVGGDSRGRKLGFPTANIDPHHEVTPPKGVYLIQAWLGKRKLLGLANIGFRPTFKKEKKEIIEIHLLNFRKSIYGKDLRIVFMKRLRCEKRFAEKSHLIEQINRDIQQARSYFSV